MFNTDVTGRSNVTYFATAVNFECLFNVNITLNGTD